MRTAHPIMRQGLVNVIAPNSAKPFSSPSSTEGRHLRTLTGNDFWDGKESYSHKICIVWGSPGAVVTTVYHTVTHFHRNKLKNTYSNLLNKKKKCTFKMATWPQRSLDSFYRQPQWIPPIPLKMTLDSDTMHAQRHEQSTRYRFRTYRSNWLKLNNTHCVVVKTCSSNETSEGLDMISNTCVKHVEWFRHPRIVILLSTQLTVGTRWSPDW